MIVASRVGHSAAAANGWRRNEGWECAYCGNIHLASGWNLDRCTSCNEKRSPTVFDKVQPIEPAPADKLKAMAARVAGDGIARRIEEVMIPYLPTGKQERKETPMASGLLDYFAAALAEVAKVSFIGNQQHNPGEPLGWSRSKSTDHADCIIRHLADRGFRDDDGTLHSAKLAWRALALLQIELEASGRRRARAARD